MRIFNVHERRLSSSVETVGKLLDSLSSADDRLWPYENWPAIEFDAPLGKGARGGHGPVKYTVHDYVPARRVEFLFDNQGITAGFRGRHYFEVQPMGDCALLRHVIDAESSFATWLHWSFIIRPLHNALVEDALDKAELQSAANAAVKNQAHWGKWVRVLRWMIRRREL